MQNRQVKRTSQSSGCLLLQHVQVAGGVSHAGLLVPVANDRCLDRLNGLGCHGHVTNRLSLTSADDTSLGLPGLHRDSGTGNRHRGSPGKLTHDRVLGDLLDDFLGEGLRHEPALHQRVKSGTSHRLVSFL